MPPPTVHWHGTAAESAALVAAITHNCTCEFKVGVRQSTCPPHEMMVSDQRAMDGLVFMRRRARQLYEQEHLPEARA